MPESMAPATFTADRGAEGEELRRSSPHSPSDKGWLRRSTPMFFGLFEGPLKAPAFGSCTVAVVESVPKL